MAGATGTGRTGHRGPRAFRMASGPAFSAEPLRTRPAASEQPSSSPSQTRPQISAGSILAGRSSPAQLAVLAPLVVSEFGASGHAVLATGVAKTSWGSRLEIWRFVSGLVENKPLFGWGLDSSRVFPGLIPLHPHNAAVQIWFELGAVGAGVAAIFFVWMFSQVELIRRRDPALAGAAAATICAYLAIGGLGALVIMALDATRLQRVVTARDAFSRLLPL